MGNMVGYWVICLFPSSKGIMIFKRWAHLVWSPHLYDLFNYFYTRPNGPCSSLNEFPTPLALTVEPMVTEVGVGTLSL